MVKNVCCSFRGPEFDSKTHPIIGSLQLIETSVLWGLTLSVVLYGHPHTNVHTHTPIHKYIKKNRVDPMHVAWNWNTDISFPFHAVNSWCNSEGTEAVMIRGQWLEKKNEDQCNPTLLVWR